MNATVNRLESELVNVRGEMKKMRLEMADTRARLSDHVSHVSLQFCPLS